MTNRERPLIVPSWLAAILVSVAVAEFFAFTRWAVDMHARVARIEAVLEHLASRDGQNRSVAGKR